MFYVNKEMRLDFFVQLTLKYNLYFYNNNIDNYVNVKININNILNTYV